MKKLLIGLAAALPLSVSAETDLNVYCPPVSDAAKGVYAMKLEGNSWDEIAAAFQLDKGEKAYESQADDMLLTVSRRVYALDEGRYSQSQIGEIAMELCRTYGDAYAYFQRTKAKK